MLFPLESRRFRYNQRIYTIFKYFYLKTHFTPTYIWIINARDKKYLFFGVKTPLKECCFLDGLASLIQFVYTVSKLYIVYILSCMKSVLSFINSILSYTKSILSCIIPILSRIPLDKFKISVLFHKVYDAPFCN